MFGPRPQLRSYFIPSFAPSLYRCYMLVPLWSYWQFRREQFEKIGVKKIAQQCQNKSANVCDERASDNSLRGGSSVADYRLSSRSGISAGGAQSRVSTKLRGSGGVHQQNQKKKKNGILTKTRTFQKQKAFVCGPLAHSNSNTLIMTSTNAGYFHVPPPPLPERVGVFPMQGDIIFLVQCVGFITRGPTEFCLIHFGKHQVWV